MKKMAILSSQWHGQSGIPVVFLHGLLGSQQDWQAVIHRLQNFPNIRPLTIDLPFHGLSTNISCVDFSDLRQQLHATLDSLIGSQPFYLVGYSLGGRAALDYTINQDNPYLQGTVLEGTNIGLDTAIESQARWQNDCRWANRFRQEPIEQVLEDWYQQPVFADLSFVEREYYIHRRKDNSGKLVAQMLEATSLAKQQNFARQLKQTDKRIIFFVGEKDTKFRQLAEKNQLPTEIIHNVGHNSHQANVDLFVKKLVSFIYRHDETLGYGYNR